MKTQFNANARPNPVLANVNSRNVLFVKKKEQFHSPDNREMINDF